MSYNQQELFQILNIFASSTFIALCMAIAWGMEGKKTSSFYVMIVGLFRIMGDDVELFFKGAKSSPRSVTYTERLVSKVTFLIGLSCISFYWASVGMNLSNGTPNAFTTSSNPSTQSWFIVGTILFAIVMIIMIISVVHWGVWGKATIMDVFGF